MVVNTRGTAETVFLRGLVSPFFPVQVPINKGAGVETSMEQRVKGHLCRVYGLGLVDVQELFEIGCQTVVDTLARLRKAEACADMLEVGEASHMLKGTLFNMGLTELGEMARNLELAGKGACHDEAAKILAELDQALAPLVSRF